MKLLCFSGYILRGQAGRVSVRKRRHQRARARQNADSERGYTSPEKFTASVCAAWRGPGRAWTACLPALQWGVFTRTLQVHPRRCTSDRPTYIFQVSVPYQILQHAAGDRCGTGCCCLTGISAGFEASSTVSVGCIHVRPATDHNTW